MSKKKGLNVSKVEEILDNEVVKDILNKKEEEKDMNNTEVKEQEYKYVDGAFVVNEEFVPYVSSEERIAMLEDMVNMLLLG